MNATMYDSSGNQMLCKCGEPACLGIIGKEAFVVYCLDCDPYKMPEAYKLVYIPPPEICEPRISDAWVCKLLPADE
jgi:hypothetical protein